MPNEVVISDLAKFGFRELSMAADLLKAYCASPSSVELGDGVHICMNTNSGFVFLTDGDYNVAMMNGDKLEMFYSCPECGREGFADEIGWDCDDHKDHDA